MKAIKTISNAPLLPILIGACFLFLSKLIILIFCGCAGSLCSSRNILYPQPQRLQKNVSESWSVSKQLPHFGHFIVILSILQVLLYNNAFSNV